MTFIIISALAIAVTFVCILPLILQWRDWNKPNPYGPNEDSKSSLPVQTQQELLSKKPSFLFIISMIAAGSFLILILPWIIGITLSAISSDHTAGQGFGWLGLIVAVFIGPIFVISLLITIVIVIYSFARKYVFRDEDPFVSGVLTALILLGISSLLLVLLL